MNEAKASKTMGKPLSNDTLMDVEEFLGFLETRDDSERWELIDGIAVMNASPARRHQIVVSNINTALRFARTASSNWLPIPGLGVRIGLRRDRFLVPDVLVVPLEGPNSAWTTDPIAVFEVLSRSTRHLDLGWKPSAYADIASLQHFVQVDPDQMWVQCRDRANGFEAHQLNKVDDNLKLDALAVELPLHALYADMRFDD